MAQLIVSSSSRGIHSTIADVVDKLFSKSDLDMSKEALDAPESPALYRFTKALRLSI